MITFSGKGDFKKASRYLQDLPKKASPRDILERYGRIGVDALSAATPVDSGLTSSSWTYKVQEKNKKISLLFYNANIQDGVPIAIILQYGHATRNGAWVEGVDYINPAMKPIFDKIADEAWREVTK